jgi:hypothetical protein
MIGNLVDTPTHHGMARAFFACSIPGGPVRLIDGGIQIEDHGRYYAMAGGTDMEIEPEHVEDIDMTVAEFCRMLAELVDSGGMDGHWPGKIRISFHVTGWEDIPVK